MVLLRRSCMELATSQWLFCNSTVPRSPNPCPFLFSHNISSFHYLVSTKFPSLHRCSPGRAAAMAIQDQHLFMEVEILISIPDVIAGTFWMAVCIQGSTHQALLDSGRKQTTVHHSLIQCRARGNAWLGKERWAHCWDVHEYSLVLSWLNSEGQKHNVVCLTHPLILGTNWPGFQSLVREVLEDGSCSDQAWWGRFAALAGKSHLCQ